MSKKRPMTAAWDKVKKFAEAPPAPSFPKAKRVSSKKNLAVCRKQPCIVCLELRINQEGPTQPDHITSRGAGGGDEQTNLMPLCFTHHRLRHDIGLPRFVGRFKSVQMLLELLGRGDILAKAIAPEEK